MSVCQSDATHERLHPLSLFNVIGLLILLAVGILAATAALLTEFAVVRAVIDSPITFKDWSLSI